MVRPEGVEPPAFWFEAKCSIQLSYGRGKGGGQNKTHAGAGVAAGRESCWKHPVQPGVTRR